MLQISSWFLGLKPGLIRSEGGAKALPEGETEESCYVRPWTHYVLAGPKAEAETLAEIQWTQEFKRAK